MIMACEMDVAVDIPHPVLCILLLKRPSQPVYDLLLRTALHAALSINYIEAHVHCTIHSRNIVFKAAML
jgi:hypothetical protein